jgi:phytoene desaturase
VRHHSILFGPRYKGLLADIYRGGQAGGGPGALPAPPDGDRPGDGAGGLLDFYALAPVPHLGKLDVDWEVEGPRYRDLILEELERRMLPGLRERIEVCFHYTPNDFANDPGRASRLGVQPGADPDAERLVPGAQSRRQDPEPLFRGRGHASGRGHSGVVGSAKATAGLMIDDLSAG